MDILGLATVPDWLLILIGILCALYFYYAKKFSVWSSQGVKQLRPLPLVGDVLPMLFKPLHEIEIENYKKLGRIYGIYQGVKPILVVGEPELVKKILVKDFPNFINRRIFEDKQAFRKNMLNNLHGERWKSTRAIISQTFSSGKMKKMLPLLSECTEALKENLNKVAEKNEPLDCKKMFGAFTMDVIASCAFGTKIDTHKDPENLFVKNAKEIFTFRLSLESVLLIVLPKLAKYFKLRLVDQGAVNFFCDISRRLIKERKEKKEECNDYLQLLLNASELAESTSKDEEPDNSVASTFDVATEKINKDSNIKFEVSALKEKALNEIEVFAQCLLFFAAGYETTATTLSNAIYHMAIAPELQEKLLKEVDDIYEECGDVGYDVLSKMPYLDAFISETLRLNGPVIRLERISEEDYPLGDTGIIVPKGATVTIPIYSMHRDPQWFPEPEKFDPERFMPENKDKIVPYSYLPFGGGPRSCVALRFALLETKLCLVKILRHFKFSRCSETKAPLEYRPFTTLLQPSGIVVNVEKRTGNH